MKILQNILLLTLFGCNEKPQENYELNMELQQSRTRIERLEVLNDSLWDELSKCEFMVQSIEDK